MACARDALPVAVIDTAVWAYAALRAEVDPEFAAEVTKGRDAPRVRAIALIAFAIATAADVAQLLAGANPLTSNYVQWLTVARRVGVEMHARAASVTDVLVDDLDTNQAILNRDGTCW